MQHYRVLFVSRKWPPAVGGMETYSAELSQELDKLPEVDLKLLALPGRLDGRPPHPLAIVSFFVNSAWHLVTHRGDYDIIHFGDMVQIGLAWCSRLCAPRTRNVIALHGLDVIYGRRRSGLMPGLYRAYMSWARRRNCIDYFIANSRYTACLLKEEGFGPVRVVPLAVRVADDRERPPIDEIGDELFVLFFGRIFSRS